MELNHRNVSFIKSGIRFLGYLFLLGPIGLGVFFLIMAEALGVAEELV